MKIKLSLSHRIKVNILLWHSGSSSVLYRCGKWAKRFWTVQATQEANNLYYKIIQFIGNKDKEFIQTCMSQVFKNNNGAEKIHCVFGMHQGWMLIQWVFMYQHVSPTFASSGFMKTIQHLSKEKQWHLHTIHRFTYYPSIIVTPHSHAFTVWDPPQHRIPLAQ